MNGDRDASGRGWRLALVAIVVAGIAVRAALIWRGIRGPGGVDDPDNYLPLARSIAEGRGFSLDGHPTAYRPPLYPLALAAWTSVVALPPASSVGLLHVLLGAATILATHAAARGWGLSTRRGLLAAAIVALDPVLVAQARPVMTETLAASLTATSLVALASPGRPGAILGGFVLGLAVLCRPTAWPALLSIVAASWGWSPGSARDRLARTGCLLMTALGVAAPWALRNHRVLGEFVWTTTHGGYTLALANNPVYYDEVVNGPPGAVWTGDNQWRWWDEVNRSARGLSEPEADRQMRRRAFEVILARPGDFARATLGRLGRFWGVSPSGAVYSWKARCLTALWTIPLWIGLAMGLIRPENWRWPRIAAGLWLVAFTAVHALYWTDMRMRASIVPAIALLAVSSRCLEDFQKIGKKTRIALFKSPKDVTLSDSRSRRVSLS